MHWRGEQGLWQDFHQWQLSGTPKKYLEQAANEPLHCDLRYQGQIYDRETGLYDNRHRYYDPEICQNRCLEPIRLAGGCTCHLEHGSEENSNRWGSNQARLLTKLQNASLLVDGK
ncbi:RHS repeat-associated core domain-containing protein [Shewanella indica]